MAFILFGAGVLVPFVVVITLAVERHADTWARAVLERRSRRD